MRALALAGAMLCLVGCAHLTPSLTTAEQEGLAEIRALADATARVYQFEPVQVAARDTSLAWVHFRLLHVARAVLVAPVPVRRTVAARLLGFIVVNPPEPRSEAHEKLINQVAYPAANLAAVDILVRVQGWPEAVAVEHVRLLLGAQALGVAKGTVTPPVRTPHPCAQLAAFVEQFPQHRLERSPWCP